jgi:proteasome accessory factor A
VSLSERIFSLETEYGIGFYPDAGGRTPEEGEHVDMLVKVLTDMYGQPGSNYLTNGSKFHYDVGHPEWSLPECRSAREAAAYSKAADRLLAEATPEAEGRLRAAGYNGHLVLFKNNVDSVGNTFGCHENYLMERDTALLRGHSFLRYLVRCLVPFLTTRQIMCGAGCLKFTASVQPTFHLSQRAEFIDLVASKGTVKERGIVNLGREDEPLSSANYRRLHLILGDSNLSGWANWMKLGTTGLVLRMIEDLYFNDFPLLADPVAALRQISNDPSCSETVLLRDGRQATAADIQWHYYEAACDYAEQFGFTEDEAEILEAWGDALEDLQDDPSRLRDRADWAMKKMLIDANLEQLGGSWEGWSAGPDSVASLRGIDVRFHDLSSEGYYSRLWREDNLVSAAEIEGAKDNPPPYTRANIRGRAIKGARREGMDVTAENWSTLEVDGLLLDLSDPLEFSHHGVEATCEAAELQKALRHPDAEVRLRGARYFGRVETESAMMTLSGVAADDTDERVRRAALMAVGGMRLERSMSVIGDCLQSSNPRTRWAAQEALARRGLPSTYEERGERPSMPQESLINLID